MLSKKERKEQWAVSRKQSLQLLKEKKKGIIPLSEAVAKLRGPVKRSLGYIIYGGCWAFAKFSGYKYPWIGTFFFTDGSVTEPYKVVLFSENEPPYIKDRVCLYIREAKFGFWDYELAIKSYDWAILQDNTHIANIATIPNYLADYVIPPSPQKFDFIPAERFELHRDYKKQYIGETANMMLDTVALNDFNRAVLIGYTKKALRNICGKSAMYYLDNKAATSKFLYRYGYRNPRKLKKVKYTDCFVKSKLIKEEGRYRCDEDCTSGMPEEDMDLQNYSTLNHINIT